MGSNQGKQPRRSDSGDGWSRDERRWNRRKGRSHAEIDSIIDSLESNDPCTDMYEISEYERELIHDLGLVHGDDIYSRLKRRRQRRKHLKQFCKRKEGQHHSFELTRIFPHIPGLGELHEEMCVRCGKRRSFWV